MFYGREALDFRGALQSLREGHDFAVICNTSEESCHLVVKDGGMLNVVGNKPGFVRASPKALIALIGTDTAMLPRCFEVAGGVAETLRKIVAVCSDIDFEGERPPF